MDIDAYILKEFQKAWEGDYDKWAFKIGLKLCDYGLTESKAKARIHKVVTDNISDVWDEWSRLHGTGSGESFERVELPMLEYILKEFENEDLTYLKCMMIFLRYTSEYDTVYLWNRIFKKNSYWNIKSCIEKFFFVDRKTLSVAFGVIDREDSEENTKMIKEMDKAVFDILITVRDYEQMGIILSESHPTLSKGEVWNEISSCLVDCTSEQMKLVLRYLNVSDIQEILKEHYTMNYESFVIACAELLGPETIANLIYDGSVNEDELSYETLLRIAIIRTDLGLVRLLVKLGSDPYHVRGNMSKSKTKKFKGMKVTAKTADLTLTALDVVEEVANENLSDRDTDEIERIRYDTLMKIKKYLESVMTRHLMIYGRNRIQDELHDGSEWRAFKREGGGSGGAASGH
jgi:hypothetical protein